MMPKVSTSCGRGGDELVATSRSSVVDMEVDTFGCRRGDELLAPCRSPIFIVLLLVGNSNGVLIVHDGRGCCCFCDRGRCICWLLHWGCTSFRVLVYGDEYEYSCWCFFWGYWRQQKILLTSKNLTVYFYSRTSPNTNNDGYLLWLNFKSERDGKIIVV